MTKVIDNFEIALFRILKCTVLGIEFGVLFFEGLSCSDVA